MICLLFALQVAMAMAAKAKLLLRELKTVKADFAFAKERCAQLEEENKILRENRERGDSPEDDDLVSIFFLSSLVVFFGLFSFTLASSFVNLSFFWDLKLCLVYNLPSSFPMLYI